MTIKSIQDKRRNQTDLSPGDTWVQVTCARLVLLDYYGSAGLEGTIRAAQSYCQERQEPKYTQRHQEHLARLLGSHFWAFPGQQRTIIAHSPIEWNSFLLYYHARKVTSNASSMCLPSLQLLLIFRRITDNKQNFVPMHGLNVSKSKMGAWEHTADTENFELSFKSYVLFACTVVTTYFTQTFRSNSPSNCQNNFPWSIIFWHFHAMRMGVWTVIFLMSSQVKKALYKLQQHNLLALRYLQRFMEPVNCSDMETYDVTAKQLHHELKAYSAIADWQHHQRSRSSK